MQRPIELRNQSEVARRKLGSLAKASGLPVEVATSLANFTWDYDPGLSGEATGWVTDDGRGPVAKDQLERLARYLGLPIDFALTREAAGRALLRAQEEADEEALWKTFLAAVTAKSYAWLSPFASYFYLRGLTVENLASLAWETEPVRLVEIARKLFLKLFRGGAIERCNLAYLWCDRVLAIGTPPASSLGTSWLPGLLDALASLPPKSGLADLIKACKGHVPGDKFFKQEVLQALCYAGVIRVNALPVEAIFLPDRRDQLSPHFYANEWTFPLRFWSSNGGVVKRPALG